MKLTKLKSKNTLFFTSVLSSALINLTLWIIVWRGFPPSEIPYVIHYSILSGSDIFGTQQNLYIVPFLGLVLLVLNTAIAIFIKNREGLLFYIFYVFPIILQIFLFIALMALLRFNYRI
ncbi:MAG: hypothetical protein A3A80_04515 [Candidatus Terrybacteria bacterium RIFCSPLOWO2_01_FULL_44_24]|uniref:Uncharacterized protein n=1 Tax=Candidatus Terrybacteria bacterium RIFCSPHIGHO2_01_FULL_43_35 TaxID=1802361 RepID=A0A1G2PC34_9BACT|nr:MAG: hypothetical protein A2828_01390 [Candidatus Terrybacteria bacterium RIFCSPHIGHO2_01_FULL_43_35]OHA49683.1 MAG: hypothetical protein A3B75_01170 [Candidatus Terrybacteria bacterium RIFCSPHIGHO2_02_FULL_43_14]OHA51348.1 MAG: hypothetical protein A3A80_04515 [Candidatus Terrybacteria bacterium RIFCSPLOWO2_01_FULL_44_24]